MTFRTLTRYGILVVAVFAPWCAAAAEEDAFLKLHCVACHGPDVQEAALRVDALSTDLADRDVFAQWERVYDRVAQREMPPQDADQPTDAQRAAFLKTLAEKLHAVSLAKQQREGRVVVRRLNRNEYQYTVHDLLGIGVELKSLLPEDNKVAGFDNISAGLETSATHLVRYQQAADRALAELYPPRLLADEPRPMRRRYTGREYFDNRPEPNRRGVIDFLRFEGDTLIQCAQLYKHGSMATRNTPVEGRYRVRASMRAVHTQGKSIQVEIGRMSTDRFGHEKLEHLLDIRDVRPGQAQIIEVTADLKRDEQVYLSGRNLTHFTKLQRQPDWKPVEDDFQGPGLAIDWIELEGPLTTTDGYREFFGGLPRVPHRFYEDALAGKPLQDWSKWHPNEFPKPHNRLRLISRAPHEDAERLLRRFVQRALRGMAQESFTAPLVRRTQERLDRGEPLEDALRAGYKEVLCSPQFLLRIEEPGKLDDFALASRLSYFLWSSLPDDELLELAAQGQLRQPEVLRAQTERLLADWRSERFVRHFTGQWLELDKLHEMKPDVIYVEYDEDLAWSMGEETRRFFEEVLANNLPVSQFAHSDWSMLNQRLAQHYGIPGVDGMDFRRVTLPPAAHRGGVVTHASILKLTTNATYTSPIKRGAWLLDRIVGKPPAPPPPTVEAIEPDIRGAVTIREQMALHKTQRVCASCHRKIDPPGFALENFDVVGGWRERYRVATGNSEPGEKKDYVELANFPGRKVWLARPVEAFGEAPDGSTFANIDDYKQILLRDKDQLARNLAEKLLVYGTGAALEFADREAVEEIVSKAKADNYGFRTLLHAVVQSRVFQSK